MLNQHQTIKDNIEKYNQDRELVSYLGDLIGDKKEVKIADIGSGAFSTIGRHWSDAQVNIYPSDSQDFTDFYKKYNVVPLFPIAYQNMEKLSYPSNFFDIVHCQNALDHTVDALTAVKEMIRVCKPGGWIYIDCSLHQLDTGHKHKWNAQADGIFTNDSDSFDLREFGFNIQYINNGGESRYNHIIATLKKEV